MDNDKEETPKEHDELGKDSFKHEEDIEKDVNIDGDGDGDGLVKDKEDIDGDTEKVEPEIGKLDHPHPQQGGHSTISHDVHDEYVGDGDGNGDGDGQDMSPQVPSAVQIENGEVFEDGGDEDREVGDADEVDDGSVFSDVSEEVFGPTSVRDRDRDGDGDGEDGMCVAHGEW